MIHNLKSDAVAYGLNVPPVKLRHLRSACLLDGLGVRDGQHWLFAAEEVGQLAVAMFLHRCGLRLGMCFVIARLHAAKIHSVLSPQAAPDPILTIQINDQLADGCAVTTESNPEGAQALLGVNVARIVGDAMIRLREFMRAQPGS